MKYGECPICGQDMIDGHIHIKSTQNSLLSDEKLIHDLTESVKETISMSERITELESKLEIADEALETIKKNGTHVTRGVNLSAILADEALQKIRGIT